jgi:hypothetical protein
MTSTGRFGLLLSLTFTALAPLSAQQPIDPTRPLASLLKATGRSVVCGTTIFSPNVAMDAAIAKRVPPGDFTMRVARPKVCGTDETTAAANGTRFAPAFKPGENRLPTFLGPKR